MLFNWFSFFNCYLKFQHMTFELISIRPLLAQPAGHDLRQAEQEVMDFVLLDMTAWSVSLPSRLLSFISCVNTTAISVNSLSTLSASLAEVSRNCISYRSANLWPMWVGTSLASCLSVLLPETEE